MKNQKFCSALKCFNRRGENNNVPFFRFPKDESRCKQWLTRAERLDLLSESAVQIYRSEYVLCAEHFNTNEFANPSRTKLMPNATPTIFPQCFSGSALASFQKAEGNASRKRHFRELKIPSESPRKKRLMVFYPGTNLFADNVSQTFLRESSSLSVAHQTAEIMVEPSVSDHGISDGERCYKCLPCNEYFQSDRKLQVQVKARTREKPHVCGVCEKRFTRSYNLRIHERICHHEEKPLKCSFCRRLFMTRSGLMHHQEHHSSQMFLCQFCGRGFNDKEKLLEHVCVRSEKQDDRRKENVEERRSAVIPGGHDKGCEVQESFSIMVQRIKVENPHGWDEDTDPHSPVVTTRTIKVENPRVRNEEKIKCTQKLKTENTLDPCRDTKGDSEDWILPHEPPE